MCGASTSAFLQASITAPFNRTTIAAVKTTRFWGVRRRLWRIRRTAPRVARPLSRVLRSGPPIRPVIVLGCPRSGTTVLLHALLRSPELRSVQSEGHILWDEFHHPSRRGWDSDALGADDVTTRERAYVYTAIRLWTRGCALRRQDAGELPARARTSTRSSPMRPSSSCAVAPPTP